MKAIQNVLGIEINPKFVGAFFTEKIGTTLRVFCFYLNGDTSQFDMAADENQESLQNLLSKMNIDANCSSVIIDEVVQGRVYVRMGGSCWLYTLLSTPGNVLPPFNSDISDLPWRYCWRSKAADILEYGKPGGATHCFAVRTQISENDASRLVSHSKAFSNPVSLHRDRHHRQLFRNIAIAVACLGIPIAMLLSYTIKLSTKAAPTPTAVVENKVQNSAPNYFLLTNHQISGPYSKNVIANMKAGGLLSAETMCRVESATEWVGLASLFSSQADKGL